MSTVCCDYLGHTKQCRDDLHYCWEGGTVQNDLASLDIFSDEDTFEQNKVLALLMTPGDSKVCGL